LHKALPIFGGVWRPLNSRRLRYILRHQQRKAKGVFCGLEKSCWRYRAAPGWRRLELAATAKADTGGPLYKRRAKFRRPGG
jgi:hypothetical protein